MLQCVVPCSAFRLWYVRPMDVASEPPPWTPAQMML